MKNQAKYSVIWLFLTILWGFTLSAQDIGYYKHNYFKSSITANKSGRLVSENEVYVTAVRPNAGVDIVFNKLQTIQDFHLYFQYHDSGNYMEIPPLAEVTGAESDENYSGLSRVIVYLPDTGNYKITYSLEADDPMLAGTLNPIDENFDSIRYIYKIPEKYKLLYKIDGDSSRIIHLMNKKTEEFIIYPSIKVEDYILFATQEQFLMPVKSNLRVLIVPEEYSSTPEKYFANWYHKSLHDNNVLDLATMDFADSLCRGMTDTLQIVKTIYSYVNQKINYIGLFDTWNAFIPQSVNKVLKKRFGDCKNMANLLTALLQYKGIEAYYGITASVYHPVEMDFPCLASGDHAICVARVGGEWYFLDATNKLTLELRPPGYIQGRKVFVVDEKSPFYLDVPVLPASANLARLEFNLYCDDSGIHGSFESYNPHSYRQSLLNTYYALGDQSFSQLLPNLVIGSHFQYQAEDVEYAISDTVFEVRGNIQLPGEYPGGTAKWPPGLIP